jgi:hypothetical protein
VTPSSGGYLQDVYTFALATEEQRNKAEGVVICIRGVVSVTSDPISGHMIVTARRSAVSQDRIMTAFERNHLKVELVHSELIDSRRLRDSGDGDEPAPRDFPAAAGSNKENCDAIADDCAAALTATPAKKKNPRRNQLTMNTEDCSLAAKIEAEKRKEAQKEQKVQSFLSRLVFW